VSKHTKQKILGIIGPSGSGKSTIVREICKKIDIDIIPTWTDRPMRPGEPEFEHKFISPERFSSLQRDGFFIEVVQPFKLPSRYGFIHLKDRSGAIPLLMLRAEFVELLHSHFSNPVIYQIETTQYQAAQAIGKRNEGENIGSRLKQFNKEKKLGRTLASRVYVNDFKNDKDLVQKIVKDIKKDFIDT